MAIPNKEIGYSEKANLLWEISRQLDRLNSQMCVGNCPTTTTSTSSTTTTTTVAPPFCSIYTLALTGPGEGPGETIWGAINCEGFGPVGGTVTYPDPIVTSCIRTGTLTYGSKVIIIDSIPCSTTTTTTTIIVDLLVNTNNTFVACPGSCSGECSDPLSYYDVWMLQSCINTWPSIGCEVWLDEAKTIPFPSNNYPNGAGNCIVITDGVITSII